MTSTGKELDVAKILYDKERGIAFVPFRHGFVPMLHQQGEEVGSLYGRLHDHSIMISVDKVESLIALGVAV